jgi:hypothetical protein
MKITINTQEEFDKLTEIKKEDDITVECEVRLNSILNVYGKILFKRRADCSSTYGDRYVVARENSSVVVRENSSVVARENSSVEARENSSVVAWENSSVVARENSYVVARDNSYVVAWGNSSVEAYENSSVVAYGNSSVVAWENSSVVAWGNSSVEARENSSVVAWENSSVEAWENSSVEAWWNSTVEAWGNSSVVARENSSVVARDNSYVVARDNSVVRLFSDFSKIVLHRFSVLFKDIDLKVKVSIKSKNVKIQTTKLLPYLEREGIEVIKGKVILYKKVSKEFKTQEGKPNETDWKIGSTLVHKNYEPTKEECGEGKFHACSKPYFCDDFRNEKEDKYIAIEVNKKDLYEWKKPVYPHKIAFRSCKVLFECNKLGKEIKI